MQLGALELSEHWMAESPWLEWLLGIEEFKLISVTEFQQVNSVLPSDNFWYHVAPGSGSQCTWIICEVPKNVSVQQVMYFKGLRCLRCVLYRHGKSMNDKTSTSIYQEFLIHITVTELWIWTASKILFSNNHFDVAGLHLSQRRQENFADQSFMNQVCRSQLSWAWS